jgi:formylglycine-generating enzyme required for sulfatase activity
MRKIAIALVFLVLCSLSLGGGDGKKKFEDPTPRTDAILKLFAEEFVLLTPGKDKFPAEFTMGSSDEKAPASERPAHKVTFKRPFAIAKYEVTQELYWVVMGNNPAKWQGPRNSVEMVTWAEAVEFCEKVTNELRKRKLIAPNEGIRLPSEAEWEYACRAGTTTTWSFGDNVADIGDYAWYAKNAPGNDPPVGRKKPNPWGLHEMHGYVSEWCLDLAHGSYEEKAPTDGSAWLGAKVPLRVIRGGSFADAPEVQRSAARQFVPADTKNDKIGFRCVKQ